MISWLLVIVLAYLFFSLASLGDKLVLAGPPDQTSYVFYGGVMNIFAVLLIPFISFGLPDSRSIIWIVLQSVMFTLGMYFMFSALEKFDVSRTIPTIGAIQPIGILVMTWIFFGFHSMKIINFLAFFLLLLGTFLISLEKKLVINREYLVLTMASALLFSLDYIFSKMVFLHEPFWQGFVWMRIGAFLVSLIFLLDKGFRKGLFKKHKVDNKKTVPFFLFAKSAGGVAGVLQSFAISLAPVTYLAIMNSLRGIQYIFLFIITFFFSLLFPRVLREQVSRKVLLQKVVSILVIFVGLAILFFD